MSRRGQDVQVEDEVALRSAAALDDIRNSIVAHAEEVAAIHAVGGIAIVAHRPGGDWLEILHGLGWAGKPIAMPRHLRRVLASADPITCRWLKQGATPLPKKSAPPPALPAHLSVFGFGKSSMSAFMHSEIRGFMRQGAAHAAPDPAIVRIFVMAWTGSLLVNVGEDSMWIEAGSLDCERARN